MTLSRRGLMQAALTGGLLSRTGLAHAARARVVIVGGGFGGATAARFLKRLLPDLNVTLIEAKAHYVACPFSNLVIAGRRNLSAQTFSYGALQREGINVIRAQAHSADPTARRLQLADGSSLAYDKLILSPGINIRWQALPGYDQPAQQAMPHAWIAGPQTELLRRQITAMPEDGLMVIAVSAAPFRCPPGPYERASLIAAYLKQHKPRAKLLILDSNQRFSKQALFTQAWQAHYGDLVEWRGPSDDGRVQRVSPDRMTVHTDFEDIRADVVNVVPPQRAGLIAQRCEVTDRSGWCPINPIDFSAQLAEHVYVLGDATIAAPMPKSAFSANAQAKLAASQLVRGLLDLPPEPTTLANTCYSYITPDRAISVSGVYHTAGQQLTNVSGAGGTSPADADAALQTAEAHQAQDWFAAITGESFG